MNIYINNVNVPPTTYNVKRLPNITILDSLFYCNLDIKQKEYKFPLVLHIKDNRQLYIIVHLYNNCVRKIIKIKLH